MLLRMILGNKNLPPQPMPRRGSGGRGGFWRSVAPRLVFWILALAVLYLVLRSLLG
jgi:hypothetical protein